MKSEWEKHFYFTIQNKELKEVEKKKKNAYFFFHETFSECIQVHYASFEILPHDFFSSQNIHLSNKQKKKSLSELVRAF